MLFDTNQHGLNGDFSFLFGEALHRLSYYAVLQLKMSPQHNLRHLWMDDSFRVPKVQTCFLLCPMLPPSKLLLSMQRPQILALNCLISAYSLSVLYLDGVKYGDRQMTALGILMSVSFITISRSKPLDKLSPVRPMTSIFHPALFLSILGQVC